METDMRGQGIEATMLVAIYTLPTRMIPGPFDLVLLELE